MSMIYTYDGTNSSVNMTIAASYTEVIYYLKQTLKQAGWTVTSSSDGTTYNSTGDQITKAGSGAGGLNNASAWFVVKQPGSVAGAQRQIMIQKITGEYNWTVKLSCASGFSGGNATTAPTASDSQTLANAVSIWSGAFTAGSTVRLSIAADNAAPYSFYAITYAGSTGTPSGGFAVDGLASGTYDSNDGDPYIYFFPTYTNNFTTAALSGGSAQCYRNATVGQTYVGATFTTISAATLNSSAASAVPGNLPANPYSTKDEVYPIMWVKVTTNQMFKGVGSMIKWTGQSRGNGDTLSITSSGSKDRINLGTFNLPWNGSTPVI